MTLTTLNGKVKATKILLNQQKLVVSGTTSFGTTKAAEAGALPMIANLQAELRNRTAMYEPTLGFVSSTPKGSR